MLRDVFSADDVRSGLLIAVSVGVGIYVLVVEGSAAMAAVLAPVLSVLGGR